MLNKPYRDQFTFEAIPEGLPNNLFRQSRQLGDTNKYTIRDDLERFILVIHDLNAALELKSFKDYLQENNIEKNEIKVVPNNSNKNVDKFEEVIYIGGRVPRLDFTFVYSDNRTWLFGSYFIASKPKSKKKTKNMLKLKQSIIYLLGVLNSRLMRFYLDVMGKKKDADTELGSSTILDIPIKLDLATMTKKEKNLINKIEYATNEIIKLERAGGDIASKQDELDLLVFELYGISEKEREYIDEYIETVRNLL